MNLRFAAFLLAMLMVLGAPLPTVAHEELSLGAGAAWDRWFDYWPMLSTPYQTGNFARETYVYVLDKTSMLWCYDEQEKEWSRADAKHDLFVVCRGLLGSACWSIFLLKITALSIPIPESMDWSLPILPISSQSHPR
jgi:hypothetical protein